ncbi:MAG: MoaD/ThiS family protein [Pirellulales bacterium]|nr:MoaD/ThiS family protein [Pirellulales bacterium]
MKIKVKLFAAARELASGSEVVVELSAPATVGQLRAALAREIPPLAPLAERSLAAVNAQYADDADAITPDDEVALIPPVSGG